MFWYKTNSQPDLSSHAVRFWPSYVLYVGNNRLLLHRPHREVRERYSNREYKGTLVTIMTERDGRMEKAREAGVRMGCVPVNTQYSGIYLPWLHL